MTAMFSKMMATMAGKVGAPMGLLTNQDDIEKLPAPDDKTMRELLGDSFNSTREGFDKVGEAFSNPGAYAMQTVQPGIDAVRGLVQDPAKYASDRLASALDGQTDADEKLFQQRMANMRAFQAAGQSEFDAMNQSVQLPTGYFNSAQRGLI
jgi:hypothetical protein